MSTFFVEEIEEIYPEVGLPSAAGDVVGKLESVAPFVERVVFRPDRIGRFQSGEECGRNGADILIAGQSQVVPVPVIGFPFGVPLVQVVVMGVQF